MSAITPSSSNREQDQGQKDQYCYICEDGGNIIECCWCSNACCYNIIGQRAGNHTGEPEACVSIPQSMANGDDVVFPCPKCVAERGLTSIGYFINQGARATMRISPRTSVAIVIYHLNLFKAAAKSLSEQLNSALSAFYVSVACQTRLIHRGFTPEEAESMFNEIPRDAPYHLAVIFLTEGDPQGGWWHTSNYGSQKDSSVAEEDFFATCLFNLRKIAAGAQTARVFGVACGFNLKIEGALGKISKYLEGTHFVSLVMPSTCSLLMCEYLPLFPELFVNIYYFGSSLERSLKRSWAKSREALVHTGLIIWERSSHSAEMDVQMILYAPLTCRPLGVPLPVAHSVCGCPENTSGWAYKAEVPNPPESVFVYHTRCCGIHLQVGIYAGSRRQVVEDETGFVVERWERAKGSFTFTEGRNVRMKVTPRLEGATPGEPKLNGMWTIAGRKAARKKGVPVGGK